MREEKNSEKLRVKSEEYKFREFGGITLVSLVITIIILIILAGVAINLSLGENGIFKRADEAKKEYINAEENEKTQIGEMLKEHVKKITLDKTDIEIDIDQSETLIPEIEPITADDKTLKWESSDDSIATVEDGVVTGISAGSAVITVSALDGSEVSTSCNVVVRAKALIEQKSGTIIGKSINYSVTASGVSLTNWKVLFYDSSNIYIIYGAYLPIACMKNCGTKQTTIFSDGYHPLIRWKDNNNDHHAGQIANNLRSTSLWADLSKGEGGDEAYGAPRKSWVEQSRSLSGLPDNNSLYTIGPNTANNGGWWLADNADTWFLWSCYSSTGKINTKKHSSFMGLRPVVRLKSDVRAIVGNSITIQ